MGENPAVAVPFLRDVMMIKPEGEPGYPFDIPAFAGGINLRLRKRVTFFVGENGSGKSTLLEAIATCSGFGLTGGNRDHQFQVEDPRTPLGRALRLSWNRKTAEGFFMRAESFFKFATYLDEVSSLRAYGGISLHGRSHGESFMALFANRFEQGLYILDEPEAALSPQRQLSFLKIVHDLETSGHAQFLISTHSPILMAYPGAEILTLDASGIRPIPYEDTEHYQLTRDFLTNPARFFRFLFSD